MGSDAAKRAGNNHAAQKKDLKIESQRLCQQAPDQTGCKEAVIQALVGSQHPGADGEVRFQPEYLATGRFVPEKHFQCHKGNVLYSDKKYGTVCDQAHQLFVSINERGPEH